MTTISPATPESSSPAYVLKDAGGGGDCFYLALFEAAKQHTDPTLLKSVINALLPNEDHRPADDASAQKVADALRQGVADSVRAGESDVFDRIRELQANNDTLRAFKEEASKEVSQLVQELIQDPSITKTEWDAKVADAIQTPGVWVSEFEVMLVQKKLQDANIQLQIGSSATPTTPSSNVDSSGRPVIHLQNVGAQHYKYWTHVAPIQNLSNTLNALKNASTNTKINELHEAVKNTLDTLPAAAPSPTVTAPPMLPSPSVVQPALATSDNMGQRIATLYNLVQTTSASSDQSNAKLLQFMTTISAQLETIQQRLSELPQTCETNGVFLERVSGIEKQLSELQAQLATTAQTNTVQALERELADLRALRNTETAQHAKLVEDITRDKERLEKQLEDTRQRHIETLDDAIEAQIKQAQQNMSERNAVYKQELLNTAAAAPGNAQSTANSDLATENRALRQRLSELRVIPNENTTPAPRIRNMSGSRRAIEFAPQTIAEPKVAPVESDVAPTESEATSPTSIAIPQSNHNGPT
jgi:hypothetical protein